MVMILDDVDLSILFIKRILTNALEQLLGNVIQGSNMYIKMNSKKTATKGIIVKPESSLAILSIVTNTTHQRIR